MMQELDRLKNSRRPIVISGAGVVGEAVLDICHSHGIPIAGVCDGSTRIAGTDFHDFRVVLTKDVSATFGDPLVLIAVTAIKDVVDLLAEQGISEWIAAAPLLRDLEVIQLGGELDNRKFAIESCLICQEGFLHPERAFLRSIDLIITERCSLKCRDCANLMQYFEQPQNVAVDILERSIDSLCATLDEIMELRIIGGDAFMNKNWPQITAKALAQPKIKRVVIYTNGTILPKDEHAAVLNHPNALVVVTDYGPLSGRMADLKAYLDRHSIAYRVLHVDSWLDCASLERHGRTTDDNRRVYKECCAKNMLSLSDGKLFRCPFAANAARLQAVPDFSADYVDVFALTADVNQRPEARKRIMDYVLNKDMLETCDYCNGRPLAGKEVAPATQVVKPLSYIKFRAPPNNKHAESQADR